MEEFNELREKSRESENPHLRSALDVYFEQDLKSELAMSALWVARRRYYWTLFGVPLILLVIAGAIFVVEVLLGLEGWKNIVVYMAIAIPGLYLFMFLNEVIISRMVRTNAYNYIIPLVRAMLDLRWVTLNDSKQSWVETRTKIVCKLEEVAQKVVMMGEITWSRDRSFYLAVKDKFERHGAYLKHLRMLVIDGKEGFLDSLRLEVDRLTCLVVERRFGELPEYEGSKKQRVLSNVLRSLFLASIALALIGGGVWLAFWGPSDIRATGFPIMITGALQFFAPFGKR